MLIQTRQIKSSISLRLNFYVVLQPAATSSSRSQMFFKIGVLKSFAKFIGKRLCQSFLFNKVAGLRPTRIAVMSNSSLSTVPFQTIRLAIFWNSYFSEQVIFRTSYFHNSYLQEQAPKVFYKKDPLKILQFSQENTCVGVRAVTKKRPQQRCFPVNIVKFLRTVILKNICKRLLLYLTDFSE